MHLLQKDSVLRGSKNVIDLNSSTQRVPAELFSKEMLGHSSELQPARLSVEIRKLTLQGSQGLSGNLHVGAPSPMLEDLTPQAEAKGRHTSWHLLDFSLEFGSEDWLPVN
ncbi:Vps35 Endosomal Protein Sorting Factor-Like [Manis pentadactyla]|nr:Vps35 Endosomal Protein Sorting Factor-Like [Manis pentadactyla]